MKLLVYSFLFNLLILQSIYAQSTYPVRFADLGYPYTNVESCLIGLPNNQTLMIWYDSTSSVIRYARSNDEMFYWNYVDSLQNIISTNQTIDINGIVLPSGRILLTYKTNYYYLTYSDDNGFNWSTPVILPVRTGIIRMKMFLSSLSLNSNQEVCFIHSLSPSVVQAQATGIYFSKSSDGISWSVVDTIDLNGKYGNLVSLNNSKDIIIYQDSTSNGLDIFFRNSTDAGINWSDKNILLNSSLSETRPRGIKDQNGKVWIYYLQYEITPFSDIYQTNIRFITTTDEGNSWSNSEKLTRYVGYDLNHKVSLVNGRPILNFNSSRDYYNTYNFTQIYCTYGDIQIDVNTPPFLYKFAHSSVNPGPGESYFIKSFIDDDQNILSVKLNYLRYPPGITEIVDMYDDGAHDDSLAGDKIYGASITTQNYGDWISYHFIVQDDSFNTETFSGDIFQTPFVYASDTYYMENNNIKIPMDNRGILGDVTINNIHGGRFEESIFLYSGGLYLSGYNDETLWANGIASASLVKDYQAGPIGTEPTDPFNKLYIIKSNDLPFGDSWQEFSHAVDQGADYYDGNNDGIYNPVDLNGNNQWDLNEDRPDFLGDVTAWCVYNDGVLGNVRRWSNQQPMGIEVQQTVFSWGDKVSTATANTIFIRYRLINKGTVNSKFDSVYFGCWTDPDLGEAQDDLVGCNIPLNLGYCYNDASDGIYGINPPAFGIPFLQGPANYIPGETFVDINGNGLYENGIDMPLDTANLFKGPVLGIEQLPGAKNMEFNSFMEYVNGDPTMSDPANIYEVRNYMTGMTKSGEIINPCIWPYGVVFGIDCSTVIPGFMYSGDPETQYGWLNTYPSDQRMLVNTGPFSLEINKPMDIIVGYVIGRGTNSKNSVTVLKSNVQVVKQIYESNFVNIPVGVENIRNSITEYKLNQNYPNPFNPSTKISWQSPVAGHQTLKVYDVLGNEVTTLVDEFRNAGSYEIDFDASKLSSGVYFYQLKVGEFIQTKKMILVK